MKKTKAIRKFLRNFLVAALGFIVVGILLSPLVDFNPKWQEPPRFISRDGKLDVILQAKESEVMIGGKKTQSKVYNDSYLGPVLEVKGGDILNVKLENELSESTNLHFHGSHVSPKGNSDNVLLNIKSGETFNYSYQLPVNHPPGLYWYHPHYHPNVEDQVGGGMAGAIIVRGDVDNFPGIKGLPERLLILTAQDNSGPDPIRLVNGQVMPTIYLRPGETQRYEIANMSADDFYKLAILGQKLHIISRDGNTLDQVTDVDSELMAPGDRIQILIQGGMWGTYEIQSLAFDEGFDHYTTQTFMKLVVQGFPMLPKKLPTKLLPYENLKDAHIDNVRVLTFSIGGTDDNPIFLLDGREFNPDVVNQTMFLDTTEEWRLVNDSREVHPFHIHINPFQVISVNGVPVDRHGYDDTFPIPAKGEVVIRTRYKDFDGKYVLHCHILFHEDHGMMQIVEVIKPGNSPAENNGLPDREGMFEMMDMDHISGMENSRYKKETH